MGQCYGKFSSTDAEKKPEDADVKPGSANHFPFDTPAYSFKSYNPSPFPPASPLPDYGASPLPSTPKSRRPFPPPSPAKLIQSVLAKRRIKSKAKEGTISEVDESEKHLDLHFNYSKKFGSKYELLHEIGRGHFGRTCFAKVKKGELKGLSVAVKVIEKAQMTTAIAIEDVQREVKILRALSGHTNVVRFYDACEDKENVYIVMELCSGGELLDRILSRGGKFSEGDAKNVLEQILNIVGFCHLQGVVHRDLKLENFLFATTDGDASLKAIDFGLSEFVNLDQKLNDIVGSAYYVAPEVLKRSYSMEADMWSVGVIAYIILCGCRPFWARTESGIFRSVQRANPSFDDDTWTNVSGEAKDFVKLLLIKDPHRRMTAAQALTHPWIRGDFVIPLDLFIYKHTRAYLRSSALKQAALKAVSKTLTEDESYYLREQYALLQPNQHKKVSLENFKKALIRNSTEAMKESRSFEVVYWMDALAKRMMDFEEFCAAAISIRQLEGRDGWEDRAIIAFKYFEKHENRVGTFDTLAQDLGFTPAFPAKLNLHELIRHDDENISFIGFSNLLHGVTPLSRKEID